ncbi:MAG: hypothetical protein AAGH82_04220 [Pseudomonadota bacterium]
MKNLLLATALTFGMTAAAAAATVATAGPGLNTADVFNSDGERVGFVSRVIDNQTLEISIDDKLVTVAAANVVVREDGNDDSNGKSYDVYLSADSPLGM